jgi:lysophospholipase L1-like esterase
MKKYILYIILILAVFATIDLSKKLHKYYIPTRFITPYHTASHDDDTIRIVYIGDSWAYMHQQHKQCLIPHIIKVQTNCPTRVYSYGLGGRTSNEIYEALFQDKTLGKLLREKGADYCLISAGINDVNKKLSTKYYKESMDNIIRFMLINNIHPVILEIPDFDVHKAYRGLKESSKLLRKLSMTINSVPMDGKQMYRDELDALIKEKGYQKKVNIIRYKTWNNNYQNDQDKLYLSDGVHLNALGYAVLDSVIAKVILTKIKK